MKLKQFIKQITPPILWNSFKFIKNQLKKLLYLKNLSHSTTFPEQRNNKAIIIANGPSFNEFYLHFKEKYDTTQFDIITVNFSLEAKEVCAFFPLYHVLIDPGFFTDEFSIKRTQIMLKKVDWKINLVVPDIFYEKALTQYNVNSNISIKQMPSRAASDLADQQTAFHLCDKGLASAGCMNVPVMAIFLAIKLRYSNIYITGLDMTTFRDVSCDVNCINYFNPNHFYKDSPIKNSQNMMESYRSEYIAFRQYYFLADYAKYKCINIINLSLGSLLDAFPKGNMSGETYPFLRP